MKPKGRDGRVTHFLIDTQRYPLGGTTPQLRKARRWSDSSGPRQFFRLHPELRTGFIAYKHLGPIGE